MAIASSISGSSSVGRIWPMLRSHHNKVLPLRTVKHKGPNLGRKFYGCKFYPEHCGFFIWEDDVRRGCTAEMEEMNYRLLEKDTTIAELEHENLELREIVKRLKAKYWSVQEEEKIGEQKQRIRVGMRPNSTKDQTFVTVVIACCITFMVVYLLK